MRITSKTEASRELKMRTSNREHIRASLNDLLSGKVPLRDRYLASPERLLLMAEDKLPREIIAEHSQALEQAHIRDIMQSVVAPH